MECEVKKRTIIILSVSAKGRNGIGWGFFAPPHRVVFLLFEDTWLSVMHTILIVLFAHKLRPMLTLVVS